MCDGNDDIVYVLCADETFMLLLFTRRPFPSPPATEYSGLGQAKPCRPRYCSFDDEGSRRPQMLLHRELQRAMRLL